MLHRRFSVKGASRLFQEMVASVASFVHSLYQLSAAPEKLQPYMAAKCSLLGMLDKLEPPLMQETEAVAYGFATMLAIVKSISALVPAHQTETQQILLQLVNDIWAPILSALNILLRSSMNPQVTESLLRGLQSFIRVCGTLNADLALESYLGTLSVHCLPEPFSLSQDR